MFIKPKKTYWHRLLAYWLEVLLRPFNIDVITNIPVYHEPPEAEIILLDQSGKGWTSKEQNKWLADGLRQSTASQLLLEYKHSESLSIQAVQQLLVYDYLYRQKKELDEEAIDCFLISSMTPQKSFLDELLFKPTSISGIYRSPYPWIERVELR